MRLAASLLLFAWAAPIAAACSATRGGELEPRYVAVHNTLAAMGLAQVGPIQQGSLAEGRESRVRLDLGAQCTTIVAIGSPGVRDLDIALLDADDKPITHDTTKEPQATLRTCPEAAGRYTLETVLPGLYPGRTRHIHVKVQAPSQPVLTTQLYFPNQPDNASDGGFAAALVMDVQPQADGSQVGAFDFVLDLG